jgi:hypothetical protein
MAVTWLEIIGQVTCSATQHLAGKQMGDIDRLSRNQALHHLNKATNIETQENQLMNQLFVWLDPTALLTGHQTAPHLQVLLTVNELMRQLCSQRLDINI